VKSPQQAKSVLIALKVDAETAAALDAVPNKSEFIREAVRARLEDLCPLCGGTGRRPGGGFPPRGRRHQHALPSAQCSDCGQSEVVIGDLESRERGSLVREMERLKSFLAFGDYFCPPCYEKSRVCDRCGHRIPGRTALREAHACAR
jgi:hypothetical protein